MAEARAQLVISVKTDTAAANQAKQQIGGIKSAIDGIVKGAAMVGVGIGMAQLVQGTIGAAKEMYNLAAAMEQNKIAFTNMLGSGEKAAAFLQQLSDFSAKTPFEFTDLTVAAKRMMAFGFEAEKVIPMMTAIGDAAAGMGAGAETINRVTLALGQMSAKGKVSAGEMLQLTEAGIPAWKYLADAIGVTTAEVQKMSERGLIPAEKAIDAILAGMTKDFGGMMADQATTATGALSTLVDELTMLKTSIGEDFLPAGKEMIAWLTELVQKISVANEAAWTRREWDKRMTAALKEHELQVRFTSATYQDYRDEMLRANTVAGKMVDVYDEMGNWIGRAADETNILSEAAWNATGALTAEGAYLDGAFRFGMEAATEATAQLAVTHNTLAMSMDSLKTIMSGPMAREQESYYEKQKDIGQQIADTKAELDKLTAANGKTVTVTKESTASDAELFLAQDKLSDATTKLADAQKELAENTDPDKQHDLAVKVAEAQVSFDRTKGAVEEMGGSVETWTVNNNSKIDEQKSKLEELNAQYAENARAHEEATARIIFDLIQQKVVADGVQDGEIAFLAEIGQAWGLYDQQTADAMASVDRAITEHGLNAKAVLEDLAGTALALPNVERYVNYTVSVNKVSAAAGDIGLGETDVVVKDTGEVVSDNRKAAGGPVGSGNAYMVGEQGPEMFVPSQSGTIVPNGGAYIAQGAITVNAAPGMDTGAVARAVMTEIARQTRAAQSARAGYMGR